MVLLVTRYVLKRERKKRQQNEEKKYKPALLRKYDFRKEEERLSSVPDPEWGLHRGGWVADG